MAANLYAKSIFGEDVLANLSIEKPVHLPPTAPVQGHIRIRAKSQVGTSVEKPVAPTGTYNVQETLIRTLSYLQLSITISPFCYHRTVLH